MPEEERWCGDAGDVMIFFLFICFFLEIDLAASYITETVSRRSGDLQIENIMRPSARLPICNVALKIPRL